MKKMQKIVALALGSVMATALFAACGGGGGGAGGTAVSARICYDNLDAGYVSEADTKVAVEGAKNIMGYDAEGYEVSDYSTIATYSDGVFTAVSEGTVTFTAGGAAGRIEVVPAYVTDPGNQFSGKKTDFDEVQGETWLGNTHDPSIIEVEEEGLPAYYLFSTGWNNRSNITSSSAGTYGNAIHVSYDGMKTWEFLGRTFDYDTRDEDFLDTASGDWLYGGTLGSGYTSDSASWWAPDIVEKPDGSGYWLYTCVVDGAGNNVGMQLPGGFYARACILLYESETLDAGSFKPVLGDDGEPYVLMQSSILRGEGEKDVNGIDPQIIYDTEGRMYMAYGSFGSGNYMIELDPETGLRKDGKGWQTHEEIRSYVSEIQPLYNAADSIGWEHDYYGKNISKMNMEAPVLARHDNVTVSNEEGVIEEGKTFYYSMHSYDGLDDNYQMWGGRSESVWGIYHSVNDGIVYNVGPGDGRNEGNKYMGSFTWHSKAAGVTEMDIVLPGHNDLFTTQAGMSVAAYITRLPGNTGFTTQIHQYYLNSYGDIVINPNRYSGEVDRSVSEEELLAFTQDGKFKMVVMANQRDTTTSDKVSVNTSRDVTLTADHKVMDGQNEIGTWQMYGKGYIKFTFSSTLKATNGTDSGETVYYGVVRPAWLGDQNASGFTITCMGHSHETRSMAMFMNAYTTIAASDLE